MPLSRHRKDFSTHHHGDGREDEKERRRLPNCMSLDRACGEVAYFAIFTNSGAALER